MINTSQKTKEFPEGKDNYCPRCYFNDDKVILRKDCPHKLNIGANIVNNLFLDSGFIGKDWEAVRLQLIEDFNQELQTQEQKNNARIVKMFDRLFAKHKNCTGTRLSCTFDVDVTDLYEKIKSL